MQVEALSIPDVKVVTPHRFSDARGDFQETFNHRGFADAIGIDAGSLAFVQDNQSLSVKAGTVRGLHYQAPPYAQSKLVRVVSGSIFDVAVDVRAGSPTFGQWTGAEISAEAGSQIWVPAGFLHGFATLEPNVIVCYKVTAYYDRDSEGAVLWNDPDLGIEWPFDADHAVLADKDAAAQPFRAFVTPFVAGS